MLAAILGAAPIAIGTGPGYELRQPLGIAIVGGLIVAQLFPLDTTPVIYLLMAGLRRRRPAHRLRCPTSLHLMAIISARPP